MKTVIIATKNAGKAREFEDMFAAFGMKVKTLLDYPDFPDIEETGHTFSENAVLKAEAVASAFNTAAIADDSGLVIDALDGRPGVFSARYAGEGKNDNENINKVLQELKAVPDGERTARFCCALAVAVPGQPAETVFGTVEGIIARERQGEHGFGYDPIFFVEKYGRTMAQLEPAVKNKISHRAEALRQLRGKLGELFAGGRS